MARFARVERVALAQCLARVGPDAPTLCQGWVSRDLAAHLVLRERRPVAALGLILPALAPLTRRVQEQLATGYRSGVPGAAAGTGDWPGYAALVEAVAAGPRCGPGRFGPVDEAMNLAEFFVHHEDLRRAQPAWHPRQLPHAYASGLWRRTRGVAMARWAWRPLAVTLRSPGFGTARIGRGGPAVLLTGAPGELLLYLLGRRAAAEVTTEGAIELLD